MQDVVGGKFYCPYSLADNHYIGSVFGLGKRCQSSPQWCYKRCLYSITLSLIILWMSNKNRKLANPTSLDECTYRLSADDLWTSTTLEEPGFHWFGKRSQRPCELLGSVVTERRRTWSLLHYNNTDVNIFSIISTNQKAPEGGWRSSPPVCMHGFANFLIFEVQKPRDHDLDLASGQGHISMHSTSSTTSMPNYLIVASRTTEIWPFECRDISTLREVWTLVIAFLKAKSKIGFRQAVVQVPYYHWQTSVLSSMRKWRRR